MLVWVGEWESKLWKHGYYVSSTVLYCEYMQPILERAFQRPDTTTFRVVNDILAFVTIVSIVAVVLETVATLQSYSTWFLVVEWVAVTVFVAEYIARLSVTRPAWRYVLSFYGLVDLIAIAPSLLGLGNATYLKSARALRIIRLLRIVRLAKVGRQLSADTKVAKTHNPVLLQILIYATTLVCALLFAGALMYAVEPTTTTFASIPSAMWWALQVFLGGFAVVSPETVWGEVGYVITRFVGLLLLGLLIGMVGNVFRGWLFPDQKWQED